MFSSAKGKQQKQVRQLQSQEQCIDHIPLLSFGVVACTYFPTTFLKIAVYKTDHSGPLSKTSMITWSLTTFLAVFPCKKTMMRDYTSFVANEVVTTYLQTINWNNI